MLPAAALLLCFFCPKDSFGASHLCTVGNTMQQGNKVPLFKAYRQFNFYDTKNRRQGLKPLTGFKQLNNPDDSF